MLIVEVGVTVFGGGGGLSFWLNPEIAGPGGTPAAKMVACKPQPFVWALRFFSSSSKNYVPENEKEKEKKKLKGNALLRNASTQSIALMSQRERQNSIKRWEWEGESSLDE